VKILKNKWLYIVLVLAAVIIFAAFNLGKKDKTQYFTAKVEKGDIREVVEATGTINAVTSVQVGSQVSGQIYRLKADFNSKVKQGQLIAEIEPSLFQGALLQAKADLENGKANLAAAKANLEKAKATQVQAKADYIRTAGLAKEGVMSQQQFDLAKANADSADAAVSAADATVTQSVAQVQQRDAAVSVAQTNLDHTYIYAPIDGTVINRTVDVGQTVAASLQAPQLFTIAQDLTKMLVYTKTDESDVGQIRPGQPVTFKVDAFPKDTFRGNVLQVRMNPTTVQNVVTYDTIIEFDNPDLKLFPGMTAYVTIPVQSAHDVVQVPNGALRFNPDMKPEELRALLKQNGIEMNFGRRQMAGGDQQSAGPQGAQQGGPRAPGAQGAPATADGRPGGSGSPSGPGGRQFGQGGPTPGGGMTGGMPRNQAPSDIAILWKLLPDKSLQPVQIKIGITDHTVTEVVQALHGALQQGDEVVIGAASTRAGANRPGGMPGVGGRPPGR
jgi:HlyD family secretion protein